MPRCSYIRIPQRTSAEGVPGWRQVAGGGQGRRRRAQRTKRRFPPAQNQPARTPHAEAEVTYTPAKLNCMHKQLAGCLALPDCPAPTCWRAPHPNPSAHSTGPFRKQPPFSPPLPEPGPVAGGKWREGEGAGDGQQSAGWSGVGRAAATWPASWRGAWLHPFSAPNRQLRGPIHSIIQDHPHLARAAPICLCIICTVASPRRSSPPPAPQCRPAPSPR